MRALLDINVLIGLLDADHQSHGVAWEWFDRNVRSGWASSPLTQNGCIRVMSLPTYPNALPVAAVVGRLRAATADPHHRFWADDLSVLDEGAFDCARVHGARQVTDVYLLALAVRNRGRLVTFDRAIAIDAVRGAEPRHLVVL